MKSPILAIAILAGMAAAAWAQSPPKPVPWSGYNQGIRWENSPEDAKKKAEKTGKPILLHQLVGDLRAEGC